MSLSIGTGPFGEQPAGRFSFEVPDRVLYFERQPQRIRAVVAKETLVDSDGVHLLHESGRLPVYYFPRESLREDLLEPSSKRESDELKGEARFWSLRAGGRVIPDAVWSWSGLGDFYAVAWDAADEWFAEDEQIFGHPRDPYSRIDVYASARHVRVSLRGELLAETRRSKILFETALPPRYYMPADDVRTELLVPSARQTRCAYKGSASYWSVRVGDRVFEDLVWTYRDPEHDAAPVRDLLCFFNERVDLEVDGEPQARPRTQWTREDE